MPGSTRGMKPARHVARPGVEVLEGRVALTVMGVEGVAEAAGVELVGRTLRVEGTNGPDRITITPARPAGAVRVVVNGVARVFEGVGALDVRVGAGDDVVRVGGRLALPARIDGGAGDDLLRAGSGPEVLLGGDGDDVLIGGRGRAALVGGSGRGRVVIARPLGTILVGPSAGGEALRILRQGYRIAPLGGSDGAGTGPIVVGVADLDRPGIVGRLRASYDAGQTVALTDATPADAERFRVLVGHDVPARWSASVPKVALVAYRKSAIDGNRSQDETTVVLPRQATTTAPARAAAGNREADRRVLERLTTVFAAAPVVALASGDPSNLLDLTTAYVSRAIQSDSDGDEVQVVNTAYGARSFLNRSDFFYVFQEADFHSGGVSLTDNSGFTQTFLNQPATDPGILQSSPQTTMGTTSVTSGVSFMIGGSIGFNEAQGFNASISGSVTVSNSTTTTYPPIDVFNNVDLTSGIVQFSYDVQTPSGAAGSTLSFYNHWIWQVPFAAYVAGQTSIELEAVSALYTSFAGPPAVQVVLCSTVPTPFGDVFALQPPVVASVSTGSVGPGQTFKIAGSGLYPSLVRGVLIGGQPLPAANFQVVSDTEITVIAPATPGDDQPVVIQTSQGVSNDDVTITIR